MSKGPEGDIDKSQVRDLEIMCNLPPHPVRFLLFSAEDNLQNVVQFYGFYKNPQLCIVMEYMSLGSLNDYLFDSNNPMNARIAVKIAFDVVKGMVPANFLFQ